MNVNTFWVPTRIVKHMVCVHALACMCLCVSQDWLWAHLGLNFDFRLNRWDYKTSLPICLTPFSPSLVHLFSSPGEALTAGEAHRGLSAGVYVICFNWRLETYSRCPKASNLYVCPLKAEQQTPSMFAGKKTANSFQNCRMNSDYFCPLV